MLAPASPNWIDVLILLALFGGVTLGLSQGLVRQLMSICALYVATTLSLQYYRLVSTTLADWLLDVGPAARNGLAMALIFLVAFAVLGWLSFAVYPSTRIATFELFDRLSGAIAAGVWAVFLSGIALSVTAYVLDGGYASWEQPRQAFDQLLLQSELSGPILSVLPIVLRLVSPWLPYGMPAPFVF